MKLNAVFCAAMSTVILAGSAALTGRGAAALSVQTVYPPYGIDNIAESPTAIGSSDIIGFSLNGEEIEAKDNVKKHFAAVYNEIIAAEPIEHNDRFVNGVYGFVVEYGGMRHTISKLAGEYGYYLMIDGCYYPVNDKMDKIAAEILPDSSSPADRLLECSCKCPEPKTNEDYIKAARKCVYQWLDTLADEKGAYRVESYKPYWNGTNDEFIAAGIVGGAKEFAVQICFEVYGVERGSVFKAPSDSGYNEFYHYYDGACAFVRCRWENGVCRVVDYDKAFMSSVGNGLYGINTSKRGYDTFFDFFNDKAAVKKYKEKMVTPKPDRNDTVISHNPFMISDGKVFYADINLSAGDALRKNKDNTVSGKFGRSFYAEDGTRVYSSPVDYNEAAMEPFELTFTDGFDLVFDDYNSDGNPDYTIKIGENEQGSRYNVCCIANDGSPRAGSMSTEVFIAERHEDSIRLQNTESGYVTWSVNNEGKFTPSKSVDDYRMYSQRYYLPKQFRGYNDENKIICYLWNNTDKKVSAGGEYRIERKNGDKWTDTGVKGKVKSRSVQPYRDAEIGFDISELTKRPAGEYRIVMKCGGKTVYGGLYISSSAEADCRITAESEMLPADRTFIKFSVENVCENPVRITSAQLIKDGKKAADIDVSKLSVVEAGESIEITAYADDNKLLETGKYSLKINCGKFIFSGGKTTLKKFPAERLSFFSGTAQAAENDDGINVTLKNNIWSEETAKIAMIRLYVMKNGEWIPTDFQPVGSFNRPDYVDIGFGQSVTLKFKSEAAEYLNDEETVNIAKEYFEIIKAKLDNALRNGEISKAEYVQYKAMSFEDFINEIIFGVTKLAAGDQCKLSLSGNLAEEVYFTVK